jgi:16S rRNA (cytidine1402-2'-O)-methyltransferase
MTQTEPDSLIPLAVLQEVSRQNYPQSTLYVLATPIGNAGDISLRALQVLALADAIACEDKRTSAQLLGRYGIDKPLIAAHQHNEREAAAKLVERLSAGERIVLLSDAGTPGISDPGAKIVDAVLEAGFRVTPLPGACAAAAALSAAGLADERFHFVGFLPTRAGQRETVLTALRTMAATLVFYEAPHRILETVQSLSAVFEPARRMVFARELTKMFEEIHRCPLHEAAAWLSSDPNRQKGEFVLLVEGAPSTHAGDTLEEDRILKILLAACPVSQAAALAAQITGGKKNALYERALQLARDGRAG